MAYKKNGFTIVELMIAITIFAVAITLILSGVLYIGRKYQQTSMRVALEDSSRTIHNQIANSIKFSSAAPQPPVSNGNYSAFCIGNEMYVFGSSLISSNATYAGQVLTPGLFYKRDDCATVANINPTGGTNLLPEGALVGTLAWDTTSNKLTTVFIKSAGSDLLSYDPPPASDPSKTKCDISKPGREYCSFVKLETTAVGRL